MRKILILLASAAALAAGPANAATTFSFQITSTLFGNGSGTFTTATDASQGPALITSLTGTLDGNAMTLLAPGSYPGGVAYANDNLFTETSPYLTYLGVSFSSGQFNYNLFNDQGTVHLCGRTNACNVDRSSTFSVQALTTAVPEPATWTFMLLGFGMAGASLRYRRRTTVTYA